MLHTDGNTLRHRCERYISSDSVKTNQFNGSTEEKLAVVLFTRYIDSFSRVKRNDTHRITHTMMLTVNIALTSIIFVHFNAHVVSVSFYLMFVKITHLALHNLWL